ncbi:hypothetical protein GDO81_029739 [Engystomops pustulosus]|uniref:Uncharacterized protein n=1 Tax=Engystomops pustulosus TaxID=76066 RepID=A0AAV6ZEU1_ENGPU|nr:hypothetical protein GDO81_029739 [Engystomops pustulosus]
MRLRRQTFHCAHDKMCARPQNNTKRYTKKAEPRQEQARMRSTSRTSRTRQRSRRPGCRPRYIYRNTQNMCRNAAHIMHIAEGSYINQVSITVTGKVT